MAGFNRVGGKDSEVKERTISSEAIPANYLVMASRSTGAVTVATASVTVSLLQGGGINIALTTTADTIAKLQDIVYGAEYIVSSTNNSDATHNYQRMTIGANGGTINNTGTDDGTNGVFMQTGVIGAAANKKIKGEFIRALT